MAAGLAAVQSVEAGLGGGPPAAAALAGAVPPAAAVMAGAPSPAGTVVAADADDCGGGLPVAQIVSYGIC